MQENPFVLCAITLPEPDTDRSLLMTAYPMPHEGIERRMVVCDVEERCLGLEGWIHAETESEVPISFFATDYFMHPDRYARGSRVEVSLSGLAYSMKAATPREIVIDDQERPQFFREVDANFQEGEPIRINTQGAAILFPMEDWEPFDYQFQGPLRQRRGIMHKARPFNYLRITVARAEDDDDVDMLVLAGDHVLRSELPGLNADVAGAMCIMGRLADFHWPS
jgi:hypothetical protein